MLNWLKQKSMQKHEENIRQCLSELVTVGKELDENLLRTGTLTPAEIRRGRKVKDRLVIHLAGGPITLEEVKARILDPVLSDPNVTDGAKMGINHAYEYVRSQIGSS